MTKIISVFKLSFAGMIKHFRKIKSREHRICEQGMTIFLCNFWSYLFLNLDYLMIFLMHGLLGTVDK